MNRSSGVLLPFFSLPGPFGIGVMGQEALLFADALHTAGCKYWLVLPLSPPGGYNSPYQCSSSFAGNPLFIDPRGLYRHALISAEDYEALYQEHQSKVNYEEVIPKHRALLHKAFTNLSEQDRQALYEFWTQEAYWIDDYSLFMALKEHFGFHLPWWEWPDAAFREKDPGAIHHFRETQHELILYYVYEQYEFTRQWKHLKKAINDLDIEIIGDLPIYPSTDSAEFWAHPEEFETDEKGMPTRVAGVPPDYFSEDGQLWGNPLYRWDKMKENGYQYWMRRVGKQLEWYDALRIDHFRAFANYWAIPADADTARNGVWEFGPGMDLFNVLFQHFPKECIIAEDLGDLDQHALNFFKEADLPGMSIFQFSFGPNEYCTTRPHSYKRKLVAFTGTHDNNTMMGWANAIEQDEWQRACDYLGLNMKVEELKEGADNPLCQASIRVLFQSVADLIIIPVQDLLGLGSEYRINIPSTVGDNWNPRFSQEQLWQIDVFGLRRLNDVTQRTPQGRKPLDFSGFM